MKTRIVLLSLCALSLVGCAGGHGNARPTGIDSVKLIMHAFVDSLLPETITYAQADTAKYATFSDTLLKHRFSGRSVSTIEGFNVVVEEDTAYKSIMVVSIGKFVDNRNIFAAAYREPDSLLCFYRLEGKKWKEVGYRTTTLPIIWFKSEELNAKSGNEIVASTGWNMNGNTWMEIYRYDEKKDEVCFAGDFSTDYTVNLSDSTIYEEYGGSWYMDLHKTVYIWYNDTLVTFRYAVMEVPKTMESDTVYLAYYENPKLGYSTEYNLLFRELYDPTNKKHQKYWDDFFKLGKKPLEGTPD